MNWVFMPSWSTRIIALVGVAMLILAVLRWARERHHTGLLILRVLVLTCLLLILLNPQAFVPNQRKDKPTMVVLLDTSASMWTRDVGGESRMDTATAFLNNPAAIS